MFRLWDTVIEPIIQALQPKTIVEIGAASGRNTNKILRFCANSEAVLHCIDPKPQFEPDQLRGEFGERFVMHTDLSLKILSSIHNIDLVLVDGAHNWYTVFNELKLLDKAAADDNRPFPFVILHDVGWPYGRRDLYYFPESIPAEYRKPYKKLGLLPGRSEPVEDGGLNSDLNNAIYENVPKSGVLTAVEDFIKANEREFQFVQVPGFHGLGLLFPKKPIEENVNLGRLVSELTLSQPLRLHTEAVESARLDLEITRVELSKTFEDQKNKWSAKQEELKKDIESKARSLAEREGELKSDSEKHKQQTDKLQNQESEIASLNSRLSDQQRVLEENKKRIEVLQAKLGRAEAEAKDTRIRLDSQAQAVKERDGRIQPLKKKLADAERALKLKADELTKMASLYRQAKQLERLIPWFDQLRVDIRKLLSSQRWKVGETLGEIKRRILVRSRTPMPSERIQRVMEQYQEWKASYQHALHPQTPASPGATAPAPRLGPPFANPDTEQLSQLISEKIKEPISRLWNEIRLTQRLLEGRTQASGARLEVRRPEVLPKETDYSKDPRFMGKPLPVESDKGRQAEFERAYRLMRSKSIFFILEHLRPSGGPNVVMKIAAQLVQYGYDVGIVSPQLPPTPCGDFDVLDFSSPRLKYADAIVATAWPTMYRLNELESSGNFLGQKVLFCQSNEPDWWPPEKKNVPGYPGDKWHQKARKAFLSRGYRHIIIADGMRSLKEKYGFEVVGKVRVATPRLTHMTPKHKIGPNWVVGFVNRGKLAWFKGRKDCLAVMSLLRKRYPWLIIHAIGFDPPDSEITHLDIIYHQNPSDTEINDFYNDIDVYFSPSYIEGCPLPQQEAMWCGCPVVTTPVGVKGEFDRLGDESTCMMVEPSNILEMANAIGSLLEDSALWNKYRLLGLRGIQQRTTHQMVDDFVLSLSKALEP